MATAARRPIISKPRRVSTTGVRWTTMLELRAIIAVEGIGSTLAGSAARLQQLPVGLVPDTD